MSRKEWVLQCLARRDTVFGIVLKDALQQVAKVVIECVCWGKHLPQALHLLDKLSRVLARFLVGIIETTGGAKHLLSNLGTRPNDTPIDPSTDNLHHGQVFQIIVRLEQGVPGTELYQDAADRPDIARKAPPHA